MVLEDGCGMAARRDKADAPELGPRWLLAVSAIMVLTIAAGAQTE